ncbi:hypothetical protein AGMMS49944_29570 [Spirochaetia bacterium]|nr:hypothetical protein AGMMS49944_29570 [Spirochaetia bacterium]
MAAGTLQDKRQQNVRIAAAVFLAPTILIMLIYIVYPIIDSFITSTLEWNGRTPPCAGRVCRPCKLVAAGTG